MTLNLREHCPLPLEYCGAEPADGRPPTSDLRPAVCTSAGECALARQITGADQAAALETEYADYGPGAGLRPRLGDDFDIYGKHAAMYPDDPGAGGSFGSYL